MPFFHNGHSRLSVCIFLASTEEEGTLRRPVLCFPSLQKLFGIGALKQVSSGLIVTASCVLLRSNILVGLVALWAVLLLTSGPFQQAQAPVVVTASPHVQTTVHAPTEFGALTFPVGPPVAAISTRPVGNADGGAWVGLSSRPPTSSIHLSLLDEPADAPGRRATRAQSCAALCVFLC